MAAKDIVLKFEEVEGPLVEKFMKAKFKKYVAGDFVRVNPSSVVLHAHCQQNLETIRQFAVRSDDVWVITYPKSGTTWMQEMVWLLLNNLDFDTARNVSHVVRSPFFDRSYLFHMPETNIDDLKSPRCIKSHLPVPLLPAQLWTVKPKIIYVARQAKDVAVSAFHHHRRHFAYPGTIEDFVEAFMAGIAGFGNMWEHVLGFWKLRMEPNIMFITFEEMKQDLPDAVKRVATFLNCKITSDQMEELCKHLSFESMKNNPSVSHVEEVRKFDQSDIKGKIEPFMRKGEAGGWKSELTTKLAKQIDTWSQECLRGTDYPLTI